MKLLYWLLLSAVPLFSQPFSFGIKGGVPFTDFLNATSAGGFAPFTSFVSTTNRYIIGPAAELRLPFGLGVELDALYRHFNYTASGFLVDVTYNSSTTGSAWEFPLMAKYRFRAKIIRPYVDAGVALDWLSRKQNILPGGLTQTITQLVVPTHVTTTTSSSTPIELQHNTVTGFVTGVGVDIHVLLLHVSPEIRYTRWGAQHFLSLNGGLSSDQNQAEFLLGVTF